MVRAVSQPASQPMGYIVVTFRVHREDGQFVSVCPELDTASCGDTVDEALHNIRDATLQYLNAIEANGERERIFKKRNIPIYPAEPRQERLVQTNKDVVSSVVLPLPAGMGKKRGTATAVL
jgi:predicted RNase H-like HicB family nuclease